MALLTIGAGETERQRPSEEGRANRPFFATPPKSDIKTPIFNNASKTLKIAPICSRRSKMITVLDHNTRTQYRAFLSFVLFFKNCPNKQT